MDSKTFRWAHEAIATTIAQIQPAVRSYAQAKPLLRQLREQLLAHLGRQDEAMFAELLARYAMDRRAAKMLEFLRHDLKEMKIHYLIFFDQYDGDIRPAEMRGFPKACQEFLQKVLDRIKMEEEYLFPLFDGRGETPETGPSRKHAH